jgi:hypothetical protein
VPASLPIGGALPSKRPSGSSRSIFFCSLRIASMTASGRGGQPGTYTSTGMIESTPWTTA